MITNLADILSVSAAAHADKVALKYKSRTLTYEELLASSRDFAGALQSLGFNRNDRLAVFADKQPETVISMFGGNFAGGVFVPVNPLLRPNQVEHILKDCSVKILVTTGARLQSLAGSLDDCPNLGTVIVTDSLPSGSDDIRADVLVWDELVGKSASLVDVQVVASDMAAIMYTSGSTGKPKGVILSHLNMTVGASSVANYIGNSPSDRILSALPLSFDAGLSQVTTGLYAGACVVLHDYLLARDIVRIVEEEAITGLTGVPPLWMQIVDQKWPADGGKSMRYIANTGGKMPRKTLDELRGLFPNAIPFLMYGLTEAFRSTYLPPSEVDKRPDSIGKAIPNVEILVVNADGDLCKPGEVGELVHRGPLVSLGYWGDPERTAHRFRPVPGRIKEIPITELAVWSGDSVKTDEDGYLYFVGRMDDMIKTSGYRVSPSEVEEVVFSTGLVSEVAAIGIPHPRLGQGIVLVAKAAADDPDEEHKVRLLDQIRPNVPNYMMPLAIHWRTSLPRNANGKLDRRRLIDEFANEFLQ